MSFPHDALTREIDADERMDAMSDDVLTMYYTTIGGETVSVYNTILAYRELIAEHKKLRDLAVKCVTPCEVWSGPWCCRHHHSLPCPVNVLTTYLKETRDDKPV